MRQQGQLERRQCLAFINRTRQSRKQRLATDQRSCKSQQSHKRTLNRAKAIERIMQRISTTSEHGRFDGATRERPASVGCVRNGARTFVLQELGRVAHVRLRRRSYHLKVLRLHTVLHARSLLVSHERLDFVAVTLQ